MILGVKALAYKRHPHQRGQVLVTAPKAENVVQSSPVFHCICMWICGWSNYYFVAFVVVKFVLQQRFVLRMDVNEPGSDPPRPLRGFRRRWQSEAASGAASSDGRSVFSDHAEPVHHDDNQDSAVHVSGFSDLGSWDLFQPAESEPYDTE